MERVRIYFLVSGLLLAITPFFVKPPAAPWLVYTVLGFPMVCLLGVVVTSFAIGWLLGGPDS